MLARLQNAIRTKDEDGFTLIELLVVIIIIGILAAIAIPVFLSQRQKGYDAQAKSDARNAATIEETYLTDYNVYAPLNNVASNTALAAASPGLAYEGLKMSANDTGLTIYTYLPGQLTGGSLTLGQAGSYCVKAVSSSGKAFYYDSDAGGFVTVACS
jgi:type IV pilus assembly protein PilA